MLRMRIIPCLLIDQGRLVKTVRFRKPTYVGDPINAVRVFNEKEVDELILLDVSARVNNRPPDFSRISDISSECFMPLCYGGGIRTIDEMHKLFALGIEKLSLNTAIFENPKLIEEAAKRFGSQALVASIDVRSTFFSGLQVYTRRGTSNKRIKPTDFAKKVESMGFGEILLQSIDRDGTFNGFDLSLVESVNRAVQIPVIALGGAGRLEDFTAVRNVAGESAAAAAGSLFVFQGKHRAVLISYPTEALNQGFRKV